MQPDDSPSNHDTNPELAATLVGLMDGWAEDADTELVVFAEEREVARFRLQSGSYVVGQAEDCAVVLTAEGVSRQHARVAISPGSWLMEDLGSLNGTLVGGQAIRGSVRIWPGQRIQMGTATLLLQRLSAGADDTAQRLLPESKRHGQRYDIGGVVAEGGMGAILDVRDTTIERKVAMKVMLDAGNPDALARFIAEARITGQLEHPNIVPVHDIGIDPGGQVFYTMKFVHGVTLLEVLHYLKEGQPETVKKYPLPVLLTLFQKVCDALAFAHSKGVIHRDLKPANLMVGDYGEVLVMDWGLAKLVQPIPPSTAQSALRTAPRPLIQAPLPVGESTFGSTLAGSIMGTPHYMSPEQARGEIDALDARSDLYSLGTILFEILHLRPAYSGKDPYQVVAKVAGGEVEWTLASKPPAPIPASLLAVLRKALSHKPAARYPTVEALQADLLAYQNGFATSAENAGAWKQFTLLIKRHKAASIGAAAVLLVGSVLGTGAIVQGHRATAALDRLRGTAPTFVAQARALIAEEKFDDALQKLTFALDLAPGDPGTHLLRGHILQTQLHFPEAIATFETALRLATDPATTGDARTNLTLCERLRAASAGGELKKELLRELHAALLAQHRTGEAAALAKHGLGRDEVLRGYQEKLVAAYGEVYRDTVGWFPDDTIFFGARDKESTNPISDLRPLAGMPFSDLSFSRHPIADLTPLAGMPLKRLDIGLTKVRDLSPLHGVQLKELRVNFTEIADLTPLAGMQLELLTLTKCEKVRDITPLKGMPLRLLDLWEAGVTDLTPLHGMPLESLEIPASISDLRVLQGLPLKHLRIALSQVRDLSPLIGMPLEYLDAGATSVHDITPLRGLRLKFLNLANIAISDLQPLRGMPLESLRLDETAVTDLSPLIECPTLKEIILPPSPSNVALLRHFPHLERISFRIQQGDKPAQTAAEFWAEFDAQQAAEKK